MQDDGKPEGASHKRLTRRMVLRRAVAASSTLTLGSVLYACGVDEAEQTVVVPRDVSEATSEVDRIAIDASPTSEVSRIVVDAPPAPQGTPVVIQGATPAPEGTPGATPVTAGTPEATPAPEATPQASPAASPSAVTTHLVEMNDELLFVPERLTLSVGDTVVWRTVGTIPHTSTCDEDEANQPEEHVERPEGAEPWNSGIVEQGEEYSRVFTVPGEYTYFCIPHEAAGMIGYLTVQE